MSAANTECVLCAEDGGTLVWRNDVLRVVLVDDPDLPGYTRVIWRAHVAEMTDLAAAERDALMRAVLAVEDIQRKVLGADKVNLASLGNMTPHLHWHVMPRWRDDPWFPDSIWAARREREAAIQARWHGRRTALAARRQDYESALRATMERLS